MKKYILFLIMILCNNWIKAQNLSLNKNLFKMNILSPGFSFERKVDNNKSLSLDANLSIGFALNNVNTTNSNSNFIVLAAPFFRSQYRYYYNFQRRISKEKRIIGNSGSFLAFNSSYYFNPINNQKYVNNYDGLTIGGVWGFQKTYKSNINIGANVGLGYNFKNSNNNSDRLLPILNFTLGWVIVN